MTTELRSSKSFRTDYKKLHDAEKAQTDLVIQKLLRGESLEAKSRENAHAPLPARIDTPALFLYTSFYEESLRD